MVVGEAGTPIVVRETGQSAPEKAGTLTSHDREERTCTYSLCWLEAKQGTFAQISQPSSHQDQPVVQISQRSQNSISIGPVPRSIPHFPSIFSIQLHLPTSLLLSLRSILADLFDFTNTQSQTQLFPGSIPQFLFILFFQLHLPISVLLPLWLIFTHFSIFISRYTSNRKQNPSSLGWPNHSCLSSTYAQVLSLLSGLSPTSGCKNHCMKSPRLLCIPEHRCGHFVHAEISEVTVYSSLTLKGITNAFIETFLGALEK